MNIIPDTKDDAIALLGELRSFNNQLARVQLEMDHAIKLIHDRHQPQLEAIAAQIKTAEAILEAWSVSHPADFKPNKSIESLHGVFGFRLGQPQLKPLKPLTWAKILDTLQRMPGAEKFVRTKAEVDKETILAQRNEIGELNLRKIGVRVIQEERFFADPVKTDTIV